MKIKSFKKYKNGQYKIILENKETMLHEDLILKHNLLITKSITEKQLMKLENENIKYLIYDVALKYLKTRLRSRYEVFTYLKKQNYDDDIINDVIKLLEKQGYINDNIYTEAYINDKINFSNYGPYKIKTELLKNKIDKTTIDKYIEKFNEELELSRIEKLINKAIKTNKNKSKNNLKQKVSIELNNLGYTKTYINQLLYLLDSIDDSSIKQKEYDKLYSKLSKKYSGYELEQKVKQKMYQKGFY